jgi:hypothetical protein
MKRIGTTVTIYSRNKAVCLSGIDVNDPIDLDAEFTVVDEMKGIHGSEGKRWLDVVLRNNHDDTRWLHSKAYCKLVVSAKEVTMADLEEKYGCKVKVIK